MQERLVTVIAAFLGGVSLLLACGALGGLMSHMVASRTSEIGLRIALGAEPCAVTALVMREALALVGRRRRRRRRPRARRAAASWRASSTICSQPIRGRRRRRRGHAADRDDDRLPPARRAARVDPIEALRAE